ncbi:MAG: helicase-exonuclease AddAB subunit AddA [Vagococcus sp.]
MTSRDIPLKLENSHFTDKQWQAVYDGGDNLLISASAGSGKTTVLVERVIQKIKHGTNVDELLIVTYTEAAAKEMKQRIQQSVQESITVETDQAQKQHLIQQLSLLPTAHISTLHAFCLQVIRNYYYLIHIDPVFRLLTDETEMVLLMEDVWETLREKLYGEQKERFYQLTENFSNDRNDDGLTKLIFSLYQFAKSNPDPKKWLHDLTCVYDIDKSIVESPLYQDIMKPTVIKELSQVIYHCERLIQELDGEPDFVKTVPIIQSDLNIVNELLTMMETDNVDGVYYSLSSLKFATIKGPSKKDSPEEVMESYTQIKAERDGIKKQIGEIKKAYFAQSPEKMLELIKVSEPLIKEMIVVTEQFIDAFSAEKEKKNVVDFNDLEHFTLAILTELEEGKRVPSDASLHYRHKFKEVLVDEYQDINRLQESILYWLRRTEANQGNLFMVGDVKQSIYAFRLADPTLFIEKYEQFADGTDGRRIVLAENFRSRSNVLDFTNLVFMQLMDRELGQIEYDQSARLITGFKDYPVSSDYDTELLIYESDMDEEDIVSEQLDFSIDGKTEGELLLVAHKIKSLVQSEFPIYDKKIKENRKIQYKDIVLLTPTKKNNLVILDMFKELDIPLFINDTQSYFQATEVKIMVALLQLIDNPYQDIPLASVLRSPIVGLKENDMVTIREYDKKGYYYDALLHYLKEETSRTELYKRIETFHHQFSNWRELARREKLVELIWTIYQDTGLLDYVGGMPSGKQRQANLHALYERATAYEEMNFKGLFQFIRFIEKMQAKDKDLAEPNNLNDDEDAVRVMTIHASKGLEFPVVFVLDMTKQFNQMDINQNNFIFDEGLGAGIKYLDRETRVRYSTMPYAIIREHKRKKMLAEEMRKLYVALTRAEQKLYLVGSYKNKEIALKKWQQNISTDHLVLSVSTRLGHRTLMDWVGISLVRHPKTIKAFPDIMLDPVKGLGNVPGDFSIHFYNEEAVRQITHSNESVAEKSPADHLTEGANPKLLKQVVDRLNYVYTNKSATVTTSYQSVSEIKRVFEDPDNQQLQVLNLEKNPSITGNRYVEDSLAKPKFLEEVSEPTPAEIGTATHLIMQLIDITEKPTQHSLNQLIDTLVTQGVLNEELASRIQVSTLLSFFETDLGHLLIDYSKETRREQPFSIMLKAKQLFSDFEGTTDDSILVHGIIDGFVETETELILYDFKTDYVSKHASQKSIDQIKNRYKGQINLYCLALEQLKGRPVTSAKLILLNGDKQLEMRD